MYSDILYHCGSFVSNGVTILKQQGKDKPNWKFLCKSTFQNPISSWQLERCGLFPA